MKQEILSRLCLDENHERECKLATGGLPESIWETYSSFANTRDCYISIGIHDFWGTRKWTFTLIFGVMYMLAEYGTFKMANNIAFNKLNTPDWGMIVGGTIISAIGMLIGFLVNRVGNVVTGKMVLEYK